MAAPMRRRDPPPLRFLLPGERVVVDQRQHWAVIVLPLLSTFAALVFVLWVDRTVRLDGGPFANALWLLWIALAVWALFQVAQWRHDRFVATDKRLLLNYGLFTTKVAMMPMSKVTDMSYQRSVPGRILGFGRFVLESAGQDQALRQVDWVLNPDDTYYKITDVIFSPATRDPEDESDDEDEADFGDDGYGGPGNVASPLRTDAPVPSAVPSPVPSPVQEHRRWSYSRPIPLLGRRTAGAERGELIYSSDDERRRRQLADTGPIPTVPPPNQRPTHRPAPPDEDE